MKNRCNWALALGLLGSLAVPAHSMNLQEAREEVETAIHLEANTERGRKVYETCAICHLPEGWGSINGVYPQIAGQHAGVVIKQLADIRAHNRDNPTMRPFTSPSIMGGVQEIADVAGYIAALPMNPSNGMGPGRDLEHGERVYKDNCVDCHGYNGEGDAKKHIPSIWGQHYQYLLRQFDWIRIGKRRNADPEMVKQIRFFNMRDETAVMDYVSRLRPPESKLAPADWQNPDFPKFSRYPMGRPPAPNMPAMPWGPAMPMPGMPMPMPMMPMDHSSPAEQNR